MSGWPDFLASVSVGGALPMRFDLVARRLCHVSMTVPCVKTGDVISISRTVTLPPYEPAVAEAFIREQVHWFYRHEADEQIQINGRRVFEPVGEHSR